MSDYQSASVKNNGDAAGRAIIGIGGLAAALLIMSTVLWLGTGMGLFGALMSSSLVCAGLSMLMYRFGRMPKTAMFGFAIFAVLMIGLFVRAGLLQYQGLFEPDGFYYYSVINQTLHNNLVVPGYPPLSGFPTHNPRGDEPGLPFLTVIFYLILKPIGATTLEVMRNLPVLFGIIYMVLSYFLAKQLSNSRTLGVLAMLFVGISSGSIARTAATVYRGDTFISLFILVALLFLIRAFKDGTDAKGRYLAIGLASITLALSVMVWSGSPFIIAVYMFALMLFTIYGFVAADKQFLKTNLLAVVGLLCTLILENILFAINAARAPVILQGAQFFIFYIPLLAGAALAYYYILSKGRARSMRLSSWQLRLVVSAVAVAVLAGIILIGFGSEISNIITSVTSTTNPNVSKAVIQAINITTQEAQAPTLSFLLNSFSMQLFFAPLGVALFILFAHVHGNKRNIKAKRLTINMHHAFIALLAYFAVTSYLQYTAIRYNALIAIPMAIFAAYGVYMAGKLLHERRLTVRWMAITAAVIVNVTAVLLAVFQFGGFFGSGNVLIITSVIVIDAILAFACVYSIMGVLRRNLNLGIVLACLISVFIIVNLYTTYVGVFTAGQADGINPQFLGALSWLNNNTPTNATVWAIWPDGSVVEGWGNRQSYMDSVGGENGTKIYYASQFLFNTSTDSQYLYNNHKPQYILARTFWIAEIGGLAQEGLVQNMSLYGYDLMTHVTQGQNATTKAYSFTSSEYNAELLIQKGQNGTASFVSYISIPGTNKFAPLKRVLFYNVNQNNYTVIQSNATGAVNYTLMVVYGTTGITGGALLGPKLYTSNLFKLIYLCNTQQCAYGDRNLSITPVFTNNDTRIYKVRYNNSI